MAELCLACGNYTLRDLSTTGCRHFECETPSCTWVFSPPPISKASCAGACGSQKAEAAAATRIAALAAEVLELEKEVVVWRVSFPSYTYRPKIQGLTFEEPFPLVGDA